MKCQARLTRLPHGRRDFDQNTHMVGSDNLEPSLEAKTYPALAISQSEMFFFSSFFFSFQILCQGGKKAVKSTWPRENEKVEMMGTLRAPKRIRQTPKPAVAQPTMFLNSRSGYTTSTRWSGRNVTPIDVPAAGGVCGLENMKKKSRAVQISRMCGETTNTGPGPTACWIAQIVRWWVLAQLGFGCSVLRTTSENWPTQRAHACWDRRVKRPAGASIRGLHQQHMEVFGV